MQAFNTHLERPVLPELHRGFSVQGLNTSFQGESSFEKLLKKEVFMQEVKAREGPPERSLHSANGMRNEEGTPHKIETAAQTHGERETQSKPSAPSETEKAGKASGGNEDKMPHTAEIADSQTEKDAEQNQRVKKNGNENTQVEETRTPVSTGVQFTAEHKVDRQDAAVPAAKKDNPLKNVKKDEAFFTEEKSGETAASEEYAVLQQNFYAAETADSFADKAETAYARGKLKETRQQNEAAAKLGDSAIGTAASTSADVQETRFTEIPAIKVRDERTKTAETEHKKQGMLSSVRYDGKGNAQADVFLNTTDATKQANPGVLSKDSSFAFSQQVKEHKAASFASMLSSEIRNNAADLVKTGSIVLRDGNKGSINLILHPEELGNVKIRLQISDNILTGRITVASEEAYHAFKANIASLSEAFASSGFDTAGFDLSWSGQDGRNADGQGKDGRGFTPHPFAFRYDEQNPEIGALPAEYGTLESRPYVNLIA